MTTRVDPNSPYNWPGVITLFGTSIAALVAIPLYAWFNDFSTAAWVSFVVLAIANGMAITAGYHRLWSHRTYQAHWSVRLFFMLFGAMALCGRNGFARLANLAAQTRLVSGSRGGHGRKGESPARVDRAEFAGQQERQARVERKPGA